MLPLAVSFQGRTEEELQLTRKDLESPAKRNPLTFTAKSLIGEWAP